jgi:hypothetical protein
LCVYSQKGWIDVAERRSLLDDVAEGIRRVWEDVERIFNPEKRKKDEPQLVPVPVRHRRQLPPKR